MGDLGGVTLQVVGLNVPGGASLFSWCYMISQSHAYIPSVERWCEMEARSHALTSLFATGIPCSFHFLVLLKLIVVFFPIG